MSRRSIRDQRLKLYRLCNDRCPICFATFNKNAVEAGEDVTLEHVPPKGFSANSVAMCLTCKKCNRTAGKVVDQEAVTLVRQMSEGMKVRVDFTDRRPMTGKINFDTRKIHFRGRSGDSPLQLKDGCTFKASGRWPKVRLADVSQLKSAYLSVFSLLGRKGYKYAESKALQRVRNQIMNPTEEIIKDFARGVDNSTPCPDGIIMDRERHHWAVNIRGCVVLLPKGGDESFYEEAELVRNGGHGLVNGLYWPLVKFGRLCLMEGTLKKDSATKEQYCADNLFGKEYTVDVNGIEVQFVCADHQGLEVTLVPKQS